MTIKDFFFHGTNKDKNKDNKGAGARTQKKSIKPTAAEFEKLGKNPSPQAVMKLFSRSYHILNDVELQNADYPPMMFAEFDDGAQTPDELPGAVGEFGRCADNPIPVNGPTGQVTYLSRLLTADTESRMAFHRLGSTTSRVLDAMVDIFELVSVDGASSASLPASPARASAAAVTSRCTSGRTPSSTPAPSSARRSYRRRSRIWISRRRAAWSKPWRKGESISKKEVPMSTSFLVYMGVSLWNSVGAAQEDQADAEGEHGEREQHEDDFGLRLL